MKPRLSTSFASLLGVLAGCASQSTNTELLPFHVAIMPTVLEVLPVDGEGTDEDAAEILLSFESDQVTRSLADALRTTFARVSQVPTVPVTGSTDGDPDPLRQAQLLGADLVLDPTLTYAPKLSTSINDRFWLNLPLFALGGPACWFVADRSYYLDARMEIELIDLALAMSTDDGALNPEARLMRVERQADETALSLTDRGHASHYLLALVVPAGFVGPESSAVPEEVQSEITRELSTALAEAVRARREDLDRVARVDFHAEGVHVETSGDGRFLVGELVLLLGNVSDLGDLRYHADDEEFSIAAWESVELVRNDTRGRAHKHYRFRIPVRDATTVQLEVEQRDRFATRRTFTYSVARTDRKEGRS